MAKNFSELRAAMTLRHANNPTKSPAFRPCLIVSLQVGQGQSMCTMRYLIARGNIPDDHLPKIINSRSFPWQPTLPFAKKQ